jgi:hypothetical protein
VAIRQAVAVFNWLSVFRSCGSRQMVAMSHNRVSPELNSMSNSSRLLLGLARPGALAISERGLTSWLDVERQPDTVARRANDVAAKTAKTAHWMNQPRRPAGHFAGIQFYHDDIDTSKWPFEAIIRDLIETRDGATYFAERVWGVSLRYDLSSSHPMVDRSVPDFELVDGTKGFVVTSSLR